MRIFLLLMLFLPAVLFQQNTAPKESLVTVLSYKWAKARLSQKKAEESGITPVRSVIPQNKNFQRNLRVNDPVGARDPNADTIDGRSAEMERIVQESRTPKGDIDGFSYRAKVQNAGGKVIEIIFWEYQFAESVNPNNITRRQFLCGVNIPPGKDKELEGFTLSGPSDVVSVDSLAQRSAKEYRDRVVINRVEYSDGFIWQRSDWNFQEVRLSYQRVLKEPWSPGMCKAL